MLEGAVAGGAVGTGIQKRLFQSRAVSLQSQHHHSLASPYLSAKSGQQPSLFGYWDSRGPKVFSLESGGL